MEIRTGPWELDFMNLERELFEAILQNPDDIAPRLVYADWCDEQGDPRGEFIRIQCELAGYEGPPIKVRHLRERKAELWKKHRREWNGEIHRRLAATPLKNRVDSRHGWIRSWEYHQGFVEYAVVEARAFLECPEALFQIGPLRQLQIIRVEDQLSQILHSPYLPQLTAIDLSMPNEPEDLVERRIQLNRPDRAAHVEIHPTGCQPSMVRPPNDPYLWRKTERLLFRNRYRPVDYGESRELRFDMFSLIGGAAGIVLVILAIMTWGSIGFLYVVAFALGLLVSVSTICGRL